jgi:hypothetical protein
MRVDGNQIALAAMRWISASMGPTCEKSAWDAFRPFVVCGL